MCSSAVPRRVVCKYLNLKPPRVVFIAYQAVLLKAHHKVSNPNNFSTTPITIDHTIMLLIALHVITVFHFAEANAIVWKTPVSARYGRALLLYQVQGTILIGFVMRSFDEGTLNVTGRRKHCQRSPDSMHIPVGYECPSDCKPREISFVTEARNSQTNGKAVLPQPQLAPAVVQPHTGHYVYNLKILWADSGLCAPFLCWAYLLCLCYSATTSQTTNTISWHVYSRNRFVAVESWPCCARVVLCPFVRCTLNALCCPLNRDGMAQAADGATAPYVSNRQLTCRSSPGDVTGTKVQGTVVDTVPTVHTVRTVHTCFIGLVYIYWLPCAVLTYGRRPLPESCRSGRPEWFAHFLLQFKGACGGHGASVDSRTYQFWNDWSN